MMMNHLARTLYVLSHTFCATSQILACYYVCVIGHLHVCHSLSQDGWTPFHAACHEGHVQIAELLLQAGASLEMETEVRWE